MPIQLKRYSFYFILFALFTGCDEKVHQKKVEFFLKKFDFFLNEPCMIVNLEQNNTIEGTYLTVQEIRTNPLAIKLKLPDSFFVNNSNCKHWVLGWGTQKPLYDAGVENIREITKIDYNQNIIYLGHLLRGSGMPKTNQSVAFWNTSPSGFKNLTDTPIINPSMWPRFAGKSVAFGPLEYDSLLQKWVMLVNECDTTSMHIYAATSSNLMDWQAANDGQAILSPQHFKHCTWAGKDKTGLFAQTPIVSEVIRMNNKWYLFLDGYDPYGKRHIGMAVSNESLLGPYQISKLPILSQQRGTWSDEAVFYAKAKKYKNGVLLFYDGLNTKGEERIGLAFSTNLAHWQPSPHNPVLAQHAGWRSSLGCTEPNYIEIRGDSILLMAAGAKEFYMGWWHHYITQNMYLKKTGNVDDAQLGVFLSTNGGKTFIAHPHNPIFTNNYASQYQNEHMGSNFKKIETDTAQFIIYQAKSSYPQLKYNIHLRVKRK